MSASFNDHMILPTPETLRAEAEAKRIVSAPLTLIQAAVIKAPTFKEYDVLSTREREVCDLIVTGVSNKEAARQLFVTEKTIKFHLTNIYKKLGQRNRSQLIVSETQKKFPQAAEAQL